MVVWLQCIHLMLGVALILVALWHTRRMLQQRQQVQNDLLTEKERAQTTLASLGDAVITTDAQGVVDYANPAALGLLGSSEQQLKDGTWPRACISTASTPPRRRKAC